MAVNQKQAAKTSKSTAIQSPTARLDLVWICLASFDEAVSWNVDSSPKAKPAKGKESKTPLSESDRHSRRVHKVKVQTFFLGMSASEQQGTRTGKLHE
mmetsp:Transcript_31457/g.57828  ORF Transcript_31457/g.57828 Transcript_31457/m.57828 type:complete len:98 (-) Transcript_31457:385-678(-)